MAVGCAPSGDSYVLPSLAAATVVEDEGFRAVNLGPHTPLETLATGVSAFKASLVWICFTSVDRARRGVRREILKLAARFSRVGAVLVVGGRQVDRLTPSHEKGVSVGHPMAELRAVARGLVLSGNAARGAEGSRA